MMKRRERERERERVCECVSCRSAERIQYVSLSEEGSPIISGK